MNIHIISTAYNLPDAIVGMHDSIKNQSDELDITCHIFNHSTPATINHEDMNKALRKLKRRRGVVVHDYKENRGLAKSWNEGILLAREQGADVIVITNDDVRFSDGSIAELANAIMQAPDGVFMASAWGYDQRVKSYTTAGFSCFAILPSIIDFVGMFDENFFPIYWEDVDWERRAKLQRLLAITVRDALISHGGSDSLHRYYKEMAEQHTRCYTANEAYYVKKWGGYRGQEAFSKPFNNNGFGLRIVPEDRHAPYEGFNRTDFDIVEF